MACLFKVRSVRYVDARGRRVPKGTPGARKRIERSKNWYGEFRDADGILRRVPLCTDKDASQIMLNERIRKEARKMAGLADPYEVHRKRPLAEHLAEFRQFLQSKGDTADHVLETSRYVTLIAQWCGFKRLADITADRVTACLQLLRDAGRARRTSNAYLGAMKTFCKWAVTEQRMPANPVAHLSKLNQAVDLRRERRAFTLDELAKIVVAARNSPKVVCGLDGQARAILYETAAYTGLRAGELASLTTASLNLEAVPPTVTVEAGCSKHRRQDVQPLPSWLAERLSMWMNEHAPGAATTHSKATIPLEDKTLDHDSSRASGATLWPGKWYERAAQMLRVDLEAAGVAYRDETGKRRDFHSLRHTFVSNLALAGEHPKTAQTLARHSDITLTMGVYTHLSLSDVAGAVERLPALPDIGKDSETGQATGTDGPIAGPESSGSLVAGGVAGPTGILCPPESSKVHNRTPEDSPQSGSREVAKSPGKAQFSRGFLRSKNKRLKRRAASARFDLQSSGSPRTGSEGARGSPPPWPARSRAHSRCLRPGRSRSRRRPRPPARPRQGSISFETRPAAGLRPRSAPGTPRKPPAARAFLPPVADTSPAGSPDARCARRAAGPPGAPLRRRPRTARAPGSWG